KNIEESFRTLRLFAIGIVIASGLLSAWVTWWAYHTVSRAQDRIYVLSAGKVLEALAGDRKENIPVEARDHIRTFHHWFFTLDPDEKVINANLGRALYLADASAKRLYDNLKENGYYTGIISGNISQEVAIDSITLDMS